MQRSIYLAFGLAALMTLWMLSGPLTSTATVQPPTERMEVAPMRVKVTHSSATTIAKEVVLQGHLEPLRRVTVRAETEGRINALPVAKGEFVEAGALIAQLDPDYRPAEIARAEAMLASQTLELRGYERLKRDGLQAETQLKASEAAVAATRAELARLRLDLAHTRITAPFGGSLESRAVEIGSFVERATPIAEVVDTSKLLAVGQVPQHHIHQLAVGQPAVVELLDGRRAEGVITYLASVADPSTRGFPVEVTLPNETGLFAAGVSAELRIPVAREPAHLLSPAVLTLDPQGQVGVKLLDTEQTVRFYPVTLLKSQPEGVWISGLPPQAAVIVRGQHFVAAGEAATPVTD